MTQQGVITRNLFFFFSPQSQSFQNSGTVSGETNYLELIADFDISETQNKRSMESDMYKNNTIIRIIIIII